MRNRKLCSFCLNIRSILLNIRSRTGVRAAHDGPEGGLSGSSRAPCAPAIFAMCLGVTRAIKLGGAPRVAHSNDYSHHAWLLRRWLAFFVIRWFSCGIASMLRRRQLTVVIPRPPPASFDATHPHGSLFYFHFSRRERAATQVVALARRPLSTQNEIRSARCHCKRRRVSYPARGARPYILPSSDRIKPLLCRRNA